jgi:hypothetical protein
VESENSVALVPADDSFADANSNGPQLSFWKRLFGEPLIHFSVTGAALLVVFRYIAAAFVIALFGNYISLEFCP